MGAQEFKMVPNRTLLEKADLAIADLTVDGGLLVPDQADRFIRLMIKESRVLSLVDSKPMTAPNGLLETLRFSGRVLKPGVEATALPVAARSKPDLTKREIVSKLYKAEVRLDNEVLEDNIEKESLKNTIMSGLGEALSRDLEHVVWNGDTASADPLLATQDGVRKLVTVTFDQLNARTNKGLWLGMLKTLPSEFLNRSRLMFFTSVKSELDWRDSVSERATEKGDDSLTGEELARFQNIKILAVPEAPENLGGPANQGDAILTDPKNIAVRFHRKIRIESDRDITAGELIIVATMRVGVNLVHPPAATKGINILVG